MADAKAALAMLADLLSEFPFVDAASRSVALSAILTAPIRRGLPAAPMHAFTAPAAGTGKSYLLEIISRIATGQAASGCDYSADEAENRKQIDAALVAGGSLLILDNVDTEMRGARLNQILTSESVSIRILGATRKVEAPCSVFVLANGNNLVVAADMTRRTLLCRMDAEVERPELREFHGDPVARVQADRGRYVVAALTVLRAYQVAARPGRPKALGSFEAWSETVRGALIWLGEADPVATIEAVRANDPKRGDLLAVTEHWARLIHAKPVTALEVVSTARSDPDFNEALLSVAGVAGVITTKRLGLWLRSNKGKIINGMKLVSDGASRIGTFLWRLDGAPDSSSLDDTIDLTAERAKRSATVAADIAAML
jgi:putative DNA primase/helicase